MATADDKPDEVSAWLDGLAGRAAPPAAAGGSADGAAHAEGRRLRAALLESADGHSGREAGRPDAAPGGGDVGWQQLLQRAQPTQAANEPFGGGDAAAATPAGPRANPPSGTVSSAPAGNAAAAGHSGEPPAAARPRGWSSRAWAAAATVAGLALVLNLLLPRPGDDAAGPPAMRGGGDGLATATWQSNNPAQDVEQLLGALKAAGAQATVQTTAAGLELRVQAPAAARDGVNALLSRLDTALGADGGLTLRVVPAASAPR